MGDFCGGPFWDEELTWAAEDPEFTFCFLQTAMVWGPCGFLFLFSILEVYKLKTSRYRDIPWSVLNVSKIIFITLTLALCIADLSMLFPAVQDANITIYDVQFVTAGVKILAFVMVAFFQQFEKIRGIRTSGYLFTFWLLLVILAIPQLRFEIRRFDGMGDNFTFTEYNYISYIVYFSLISVMLFLNCWADKEPRLSDFPKAKNPSPELGSSYLRQIFFQWFDRTTWIGYRRALEEKDIYDINPVDTSKELVPPFDKYFYESVEKNRSKPGDVKKTKKTDAPVQSDDVTNGSVLPAMVYAFGGPFWFAGILKLILDLLQFASPLLLGALITYITVGGPLWKGLVFAFALFLVSFIQTMLNGQYFFKTFLVGFRIRTALISSIYRKALRISSAAKKNTTVGEIVNLMSVDAQKFFELTSYLHVLWSGPMVIGLAIALLWQYLGVSVLAGLAVMILMIPLSGYIAKKLRDFQILQMKIKDERVKSMNEILNGIKVLKLYAWEPSFEKSILETRDKEIAVLKQMAIFNAGTFFIWSSAPFLVALASFVTFVLVDDENVLTPEIAFVSLALFNILRFPLAMFPMMIALVMQAWVSITRMNKFLNAEEIDPDNVTHKPSENVLHIDNGDFTWGSSEGMVLKKINLDVKKNTLVAVVGPVGCGKSSLISALLGEMEKKSGSVNTYGSLAFVPQQAWIQNSTLRDNILFGKSYNKELYERVIHACALSADLSMLPGGDQTEIGEKGINLSGGQKQRVSLARAVYSNADIYLLDDPLSAVDSHVGKHIFDNVFSVETGLLKNKTRLLVTHAVSFLPRVDEILVFSHGEISESGSYKELLAQKGLFSEFLMQHIQELDDEEELEKITEVLKNTAGEDFVNLLDRSISTIAEKVSLNGSMRRKASRNRKESENSRKASVKSTVETPRKINLIEKEEAATGKVGWDVYIKYFKGIGMAMGLASILFNIFNQTFAVLSNFWLSRWSEDVDAATDNSVLNLYIGVYAALGVGQALTLFGTSLVLAYGCLAAAKVLHEKLLHHTFKLPMSFFDTTPLGRIMNRFSKDVDTVDHVLPMSIRMWMMMFFAVVSIFIVISISTPLFLAVMVPLAAGYYVIQVFYVATSRQLKRIESTTRSPIYSHFGETITGQSTIRAYEVQDRFTSDSELKVDYNQMMAFPSIVSNRWLAVRLEIVGSLVVLFSALFAVIGRENISPAIAGLSVSYALQISQTLSFLVRMTAEVETNIVSIERMEEYATLPVEKPWKTVEMDPAWPQYGVVQFKDFQVRYREGLDLVLRGINFTVNSMEKIGMVGRTGAGKSSLTLALFRIIEGAGGEILIDGVDIGGIGLHSLRSRLTIIPQDPVLFSGTLRMNVDPFKVYTDDQIWTALENAHLKSFVKGLGEGINHMVSEGGENLSVGQRQLVCLARALLRKTKVLILDEATAAIDFETDDLIQKTIRTQFKDCTILTIAHRLNTILDSDRVIVFDKGMIAEFDTPEALLKDKDSIFHGMAKDAGISSIHDTNVSNNFNTDDTKL